MTNKKPPKSKFATCCPGFWDDNETTQSHRGTWWVPPAICFDLVEIRTVEQAEKFKKWLDDVAINWLVDELANNRQRKKDARRSR